MRDSTATLDLVRVIGDEANGGNPEVPQNPCGDTIITFVGLVAEVNISLDRVHPLILEIVGFQLLLQPDTTAFLTQVNKNAVLGAPQVLQAMPELITAVTTPGTEDIAGQTLGVHANGHSGLAQHIPLDQGQVLLAMFSVKMNREFTETGRKACFDEILDHKDR
jgi:hypothetical protein